MSYATKASAPPCGIRNRAAGHSALLLLVACLSTEAAARAEFVVSGFGGAAFTQNNDLRLRQSGGTDLRSRAMLAASLDRAGQRRASSGLPVLPFLPDFNDPYTAIAFNEMRRLLKM